MFLLVRTRPKNHDCYTIFILISSYLKLISILLMDFNYLLYYVQKTDNNIFVNYYIVCMLEINFINFVYFATTYSSNIVSYQDMQTRIT